MELKEGITVRLKNFSKEKKLKLYDGLVVTDGMYKYSEKIATIVKMCNYGKFHIDLDDGIYFWNESMIESAGEDLLYTGIEIAEMIADERIKNGDKVLLKKNYSNVIKEDGDCKVFTMGITTLRLKNGNAVPCEYLCDRTPRFKIIKNISDKKVEFEEAIIYNYEGYKVYFIDDDDIKTYFEPNEITENMSFSLKEIRYNWYVVMSE